jgi:hypothetical protein
VTSRSASTPSLTATYGSPWRSRLRKTRSKQVGPPHLIQLDYLLVDMGFFLLYFASFPIRGQ